MHRYASGPGFHEVAASQSAGGVVSWLLTDRQGSVRQVIDNSAAVQSTVEYTAFGEISSGTLGVRIGFTGYVWDGVLGLWVTPGRVYNAHTGRFMQVDFLGFAAGDVNLFRYVGNGPTNATDPSGLDDLNVAWRSDKVWWDVDRGSKLRSSIEIEIGRQTSNSKIIEVNIDGRWVPFARGRLELFVEKYTLGNGWGTEAELREVINQELRKLEQEKQPYTHVATPTRDEKIAEKWASINNSFVNPNESNAKPGAQIAMEWGQWRYDSSWTTRFSTGAVKGVLDITNPVVSYWETMDMLGDYSLLSPADQRRMKYEIIVSFGEVENVSRLGTQLLACYASYRLTMPSSSRVYCTDSQLCSFNFLRDPAAPQGMSGAAYLTSPERVARYEAILQTAIGSGRTGEAVGELGTRIEMMRHGYLRVGKGIYNKSGHGIDALYMHVTTGDIAVVESKFSALFNANRNAETLLGRGYGFRQMSHDWIEVNRLNALRSDIPQAIRFGEFLTENSFTQRMIVVTNERGELFLHMMP